MRLTASCEIAVRNVGAACVCVALEITQGSPTGEDETTLLLGPDAARELASVLLHHSESVRAYVGRHNVAAGGACLEVLD